MTVSSLPGFGGRSGSRLRVSWARFVTLKGVTGTPILFLPINIFFAVLLFLGCRGGYLVKNSTFKLESPVLEGLKCGNRHRGPILSSI